MVSQGVNFRHDKWSHSFVACPLFDDSKISHNLYAPPSPINMTTMIRHYTKFHPTQVPQGKPRHQTIDCSTANFGPPLWVSLTNPMLTTAFDTYSTPRSPEAS